MAPIHKMNARVLLNAISATLFESRRATSESRRQAELCTRELLAFFISNFSSRCAAAVRVHAPINVIFKLKLSSGDTVSLQNIQRNGACVDFFPFTRRNAREDAEGKREWERNHVLASRHRITTYWKFLRCIFRFWRIHFSLAIFVGAVARPWCGRVCVCCLCCVRACVHLHIVPGEW